MTLTSVSWGLYFSASSSHAVSIMRRHNTTDKHTDLLATSLLNTSCPNDVPVSTVQNLKVCIPSMAFAEQY